ncbi:MAG: LysR family transcriptional regulator [Actinobacteria bacterium]|nr:LysR family transcriptional regulator [Actinomycetota bacterium]
MTESDGQGPPPVAETWLRAFVAAARLGSFTAAAADLGIGQPAVSHAVARLERSLDTPLFVRSRSGVVLTEAGVDLADEVAPAIARIDRGVHAARSRASGQRRVTLSVSTSLAAYWLMTRLAEFKVAHPELELRCITNDTDAAVGRDDADLWVPLGAGPWPGLATWHLCDEEVFPVAAPDVAAALEPVVGPAVLAAAPLLHLEEGYRPRFDWRRWFAETGVPVPERLTGQRSNDYSLILHAALEGQGVALGWRHIVGPLLEAGRLVPVGTRRIATDEPFVVAAAVEELHTGAAALRDWLIAGMKGGTAEKAG